MNQYTKGGDYRERRY